MMRICRMSELRQSHCRKLLLFPLLSAFPPRTSCPLLEVLWSSVSLAGRRSHRWLRAPARQRDTVGLGDLLSCGSLRVIWHLSRSHLPQDLRAAECVLGLPSRAEVRRSRETERKRRREGETDGRGGTCLTTPMTDPSVGGEKWTNQSLQWWNLAQFIAELTGAG